ncbi:multicomponent Na+:H+ antiporter subunit E [Lysinibacillus composti]|uniref:Na+/H+ antiporter subunit E n=1 Tax=Lysinibacillus composti TaxID=720633 RepID=A0A3N9UCT6_9BACI|nr:Na+/H+ antiporter subunit E [Lysinibacillus composti]MBM7609219.1 multicomponent Na+:H+ antiporter subunit E [Lysinibacillus composti]RQW74127.1 Na+/H+ antiporter subunit E [Lysinibacillus composti]
MSFQILLNFFLAFLWMFLSSNYSLSRLIIGYLLGLLVIIALRKFFKTRLYVDRVWAVIKLTVLFIKELILANITVLKLVIKPKLDMQPAFFKYDTTLTEEWEITLLSSLITLTPGTVVVHVSDDSKSLFIHVIDSQDIDETIDSIKYSFEKAILEVSRS